MLDRKNILNRSVTALTAMVLLCSCVGGPAPWRVNEVVSGFDGAIELSLGPVSLQKGQIGLRLFRRSSMPADQVILIPVVVGAYSFADGPSLKIRIDDEVVSLESMDMLTEITPTARQYVGGGQFILVNASSKRYQINRELLHRILDAKRVVFRIDLFDGYLEDILMPGLPMTTNLLREFYNRTAPTKDTDVGPRSNI